MEKNVTSKKKRHSFQEFLKKYRQENYEATRGISGHVVVQNAAAAYHEARKNQTSS